MEIKLLKNSILQNNIPKFLAFIGDELALANQYIHSMSNTLGKHYKYYDSADNVIYETTNNLKDDYLYIILNDYNIIKNPNYIQQLINLDRHIILYFTDFDTKCDLYKTYKDYFVNFKKLDKYTLVAYLMKHLNDNKVEVSQENVTKLVEYCDCNLGICLNECNKIITLAQSNSNLVTEYMLNNNFPDYRKVNMFKFIYKILDKDTSLYAEQIKLNDTLISIVTNLYNNAKLRLEKTNNIKYANILKLCSEIDSSIKDGSISDAYALDYLLIKCM
jgi:DNA polymerase III delta subunit